MARAQLSSNSKTVKIIKGCLFVILGLFSAASVIFSLYVLFTDLGKRPEVTPEQARGLFTVFIYKYIDEVHPQVLPQGKTWTIKNLEFPNKNFALVEATDGQIRTRLQFIYTIEYPNVRVLKINDITNLDVEDANLALIRFLDFMKRGDYENAAILYGGPISRLVPYGSENSPLPQLLEGYCKAATPVRRCLEYSIQDAGKDPITGEFRFSVTYRMPDNSTYKQQSGKDEFISLVKEVSGDYKVVNLPFD